MTTGPDATTPMTSCPNCSHQLPVGTPICGNCGTILQGGSAVPAPLAASGIRPGAVIVIVTAIALAGAVFFARGAISDAIDSVTGAVEDAVDSNEIGGPGQPPIPGGGKPGGGKPGGGGNQSALKISYRHVPEVVRDIRAGGIPCSPARVDSSDEYLETGSCQSSGSHVQINLYFTEAGIQFAKDFYDDFAFASVHADNWWVSGDTALMARIQKAIGGKLHRP